MCLFGALEDVLVVRYYIFRGTLSGEAHGL